MNFHTLAIHGGNAKDAQSGAVTFPIYQTSTFEQDFPGKPRVVNDRMLSYGRSENPTRTVLENTISALEGGGFGLAFASGLAAVSNVLQTLSVGDHIIAGRDLYGGSYRQFTKIYNKLGIEFSFVDLTDLNQIAAAIRPSTKYAWLESPSNPLLTIVDLAAVADLVHAHGSRVLVDNTFATPYLQRPLDLGADIVLHSTTKYLNGHMDVIGGALITRDQDLWNELKYTQNAVGAIPSPNDCYLVLRGITTLGLRMEQHCRNGKIIAQYLANQPQVKRVYYPGLQTHLGHDIASRQMKEYGAMLSFEMNGGVEVAQRFIQNLSLITLAESLGGMKTLICQPPTMTHASVEPEVRRQAGIADGLLRISAGLESSDDLLMDLESSFEKTFIGESGRGASPKLHTESNGG